MPATRMDSSGGHRGRALTFTRAAAHGIVALLTPVPRQAGGGGLIAEASGRVGRPVAGPSPRSRRPATSEQHDDAETVQLPVTACRKPTTSGPVVATRYPPPG